MKLIITENKRNKVVTDWLNKYYSNLFVKEYPRWGITDYIDTDVTGLKVFYSENGILFITNSNLKDDLRDIFNVSRDDLNNIFIPFMKDNYNLDINSVLFI